MPKQLFQPGNPGGPGGKRDAAGRKTDSAISAQQQIEQTVIKVGEGDPRHAALVLFDELLKIGMRDTVADGTDYTRDDAGKALKTDAKQERRQAEEHWRRDFELKQDVVKIMAIDKALTRMLGRAKVAISVNVTGGFKVGMALEKIILGETARRISRMGDAALPAPAREVVDAPQPPETPAAPSDPETPPDKPKPKPRKR